MRGITASLCLLAAILASAQARAECIPIPEDVPTINIFTTQPRPANYRFNAYVEHIARCPQDALCMLPDSIHLADKAQRPSARTKLIYEPPANLRSHAYYDLWISEAAGILSACEDQNFKDDQKI